MRNDNYPADIRSYDHVPGSPFYEDPSEGLDEMTRDELTSLLSSLQSTYEDPDCHRRARHAAERHAGAVRAALAALPYDEDEDEAAYGFMTFPDRPLSNRELFYMRMGSRSIMDDPSTPEDLVESARNVFEKATAALVERGINPEEKS
jgi:hypothetical protein